MIKKINEIQYSKYGGKKYAILKSKFLFIQFFIFIKHITLSYFCYIIYVDRDITFKT